VQEETRMMTRSPGLLRSIEQAEAVLGRLNRLVSRQVPNFYSSTIAQPHPPASAGLRAAINEVQAAVQHRFDPSPDVHGNVPVLSQSAAVSTPGLLQELQARKAALKQAATTPVERATIEVVALMFQSLLTEERIPAAVRVWFARLQMPVLRVAIAEPDFFATIDHPARKLIDRMGACVMGFEAGSAGVSEPMEREIKRVVQVVEAYPDTGRRVFQTVLTEFERFLEDYFKSAHLAASKGVSLAQQIEQRETLAIQYTIELRKMLNEVPVHDGVREFLFHVWADVLATTAVKAGQASEPTKAMRKAAADLIWLASAKVSREERSEAIRRLSPLLKKLREGMVSAGVPVPRQDEYIQSLNNALQAAFSARSAAIPTERLNELMMQLETLEDMLPDVDHIEIDESMVRDLSGHETKDLEVVAEGGSMPTPAMVAWSHNLGVGSWFRLDYRDTIANVQLAWQGTRKQFSLFVSPQGRGILFQKHRLAAFLQAGLLVPVEEESLTVRATRDALAKLDADPGRLLH
jgi:HAMP domain-containing protein